MFASMTKTHLGTTILSMSEYIPRPGHVVINPWKALAAVTLTASTVFGIGMTAYSNVVVPGVMSAARIEAEEVALRGIVRHEQRPHKDAISRTEMDIVMGMLRSIDKRLGNIEVSVAGRSSK